MTSISHTDTFLWDFMGHMIQLTTFLILQPRLLDLLGLLVQVTSLFGCSLDQLQSTIWLRDPLKISNLPFYQ